MAYVESRQKSLGPAGNRSIWSAILEFGLSSALRSSVILPVCQQSAGPSSHLSGSQSLVQPAVNTTIVHPSPPDAASNQRDGRRVRPASDTTIVLPVGCHQIQNSVGRHPLIMHPSTAQRAPDFLRRELFPHHLDTTRNRHCTYWYIASYVSIFFYCYVTVLMLCFTCHFMYRTICVIL